MIIFNQYLLPARSVGKSCSRTIFWWSYLFIFQARKIRQYLVRFCQTLLISFRPSVNLTYTSSPRWPGYGVLAYNEHWTVLNVAVIGLHLFVNGIDLFCPQTTKLCTLNASLRSFTNIFQRNLAEQLHCFLWSDDDLRLRKLRFQDQFLAFSHGTNVKKNRLKT